ncbi:citryl-CoA lyase [Natronomonas gomsonensis]|uniref:citryl-CoA lyase n=1 Tax=Natronomonas gomsonensis TaxID=1046043 RepID=UPI0020CA3A03|nr:citryl-CoA lyase [Natronomonas gomsonensis]MCY4729952.1 citryl-CoA lyase [Natronomonas gomsonensis]
MSSPSLPTNIATADEQNITVRGRDLTREMMGETSFGEFFYLHLTGEMPTESELRIFDTLLITVVEHGVTPSVIAARLTYDSAPEAVQGAVASGLLGAGSTFLGSMENAAEMVQEGVKRTANGEDATAVALEMVEKRERLPGFGHPLHEPTDPRTDALFELLEKEGFDGDYLAFMRAVQAATEEVYGTELLINATGAIGVGISELGLDPIVGRGIALVARSAGLVGHLNEEIEQPMARDIWAVVEDNVEYQS